MSNKFEPFENQLSQRVPRLLNDVRGEILRQMNQQEIIGMDRKFEPATNAKCHENVLPVGQHWLNFHVRGNTQITSQTAWQQHQTTWEFRSYLTVGTCGFLLGLFVMYWVMTGFFNQSQPVREHLTACLDDTITASTSSVFYPLDDRVLDSIERPMDMFRIVPKNVTQPKSLLVPENEYTQYELMQQFCRQ